MRTADGLQGDIVRRRDRGSTVDVDDEDVEKWVVRAITAGLVNVKIDQLARTMTISR